MLAVHEKDKLNSKSRRQYGIAGSQ